MNHRADYAQWLTEILARTEKFVATMYLGGRDSGGMYESREAPTLEAAREHAIALLLEHADNHGRGVMIYAVADNGVSTYIESANQSIRSNQRPKVSPA